MAIGWPTDVTVPLILPLISSFTFFPLATFLDALVLAGAAGAAGEEVADLEGLDWGAFFWSPIAFCLFRRFCFRLLFLEAPSPSPLKWTTQTDKSQDA